MSKFRTRTIFSLCITFRLDERKRSQASQFRHMRNYGFECRDVQNVFGLSPKINEDCDNCTFFLVVRGYFLGDVLFIMFHKHLEPLWRTDLMRMLLQPEQSEVLSHELYSLILCGKKVIVNAVWLLFITLAHSRWQQTCNKTFIA